MSRRRRGARNAYRFRWSRRGGAARTDLRAVDDALRHMEHDVPGGALAEDLDGYLDPTTDPELAAQLDAEFPLGDGTADTTATVECPYCTAPVEILLDLGGGSRQDYVEDCEVCCQPWSVAVRYGADGRADVWVEALES